FARAADGEALGSDGSPVGGLRRTGSALAVAAHQAERLAGRPQRHDFGNREPRHQRPGAGAIGNSSGPPVAERRGICAGARAALAGKGIGRLRRLCGRCGSFDNRRRRLYGHDEIQSSRPRLKHRGCMRIYEELFIVKPDAPEEEVDQFVEQLRTQLTASGATVDKVEKWGKRRLAYRVDKYREGTYVLFQFSAGPETVKEFERRLRVSDIVLKFLTVRIDQTLKRLEKRKKDRDKRSAKRAASAPASVAPSQPALPGAPQ